MSDSEQNKTEEPTPYKLKQAREKGNIAKGMDLPFLGTLVGLAFYVIVFGPSHFQNLTEVMRVSLQNLIANVDSSQQTTTAINLVYWPAVTSVLVLGAIVFSIVVFVQLLQTRGLMFTAYPLKPDLTKLNPAKGLKRIFSIKTLKEAGKNILKMSIYLGCTYLLIMYCIERFAPSMATANSAITALYGSGLLLLFLYILLALFFSVLDQVIVRKEFMKQMRMSQSELKREIKNREGEPRLKQKRKQMHAEFIKQTDSANALPGSDMLIVNPQHYAVGLQYDPETMNGPCVTTKGRNRFALMLKTKAFQLGIPVITNPVLARTIYFEATAGQEIPADAFQDVADVYVRIHREKFTGQADD